MNKDYQSNSKAETQSWAQNYERLQFAVSVLLACENHAGFVYTAVMKSTKPLFISVYTLVGSSEAANVSNPTVITGMHAAVADLHLLGRPVSSHEAAAHENQPPWAKHSAKIHFDESRNNHCHFDKCSSDREITLLLDCVLTMQPVVLSVIFGSGQSPWLKCFMKQGGSPDEARLEQTPYPFQPH